LEYPRQQSNILPVSAEKPHVPDVRGTESGTPGGDSDLSELLAAWPALTPAKRRVILGIIRGK
jgi:hypothetical protein